MKKEFEANRAISAKAEESQQAKYFTMGAVVALGELLQDRSFSWTESQKRQIGRFISSFGVNGMADAERLGISGVYKYDFIGL